MDALTSSFASARIKIATAPEAGHRSQFDGRFVTKVENVYSENALRKANLVLDRHQLNKDVFYNKGNKLICVRLHTNYPNENDISFDSNGKVKKTDDLFENMNPDFFDFKPVAVECVQAMAKSLQWCNRTVNLTFHCLIYPLSAGQPVIQNMPWHKDSNTLTMSTVISSSGSGYTGGELSFACRDKFNDPFKGRLHDSVANTVQTFCYPENGGFIFDNLRSQHKVEDIYLAPGRQTAQRRFFAVFANPDKSYVLSLADQFRALNMVTLPEEHTQEDKKEKQDLCAKSD